MAPFRRNWGYSSQRVATRACGDCLKWCADELEDFLMRNCNDPHSFRASPQNPCTLVLRLHGIETAR